MYAITVILTALIARTRAGCCRTVCAPSYFLSQGECVPVAPSSGPARESNIPGQIAQEPSCLGFDVHMAVDYTSREDEILGMVGGDIDGDGLADYVTANYYPGEITLHPARGAGTSSSLHFPESWAQQLVLCDVDRDGDLDLIADPDYRYDEAAYVYMNDGGSLASAMPIGAPRKRTVCGTSANEIIQIDDASLVLQPWNLSEPPPRELSVSIAERGVGRRSDRNFGVVGDGIVHLAESDTYDDDTALATLRSSVVLQYMTGTFTTLFERRVTFSPKQKDVSLSYVNSLRVADMDADGDLDIVLVVREYFDGVRHRTLLILENVPDKTWPTAFSDTEPDIYDSALYDLLVHEVGDFDGDGDNDVLVLFRSSSNPPYAITATLFEAHGREFAKSPPLSLTGGWGGHDFNAAETLVIAGDGKDVVALSKRYYGGVFELELHDRGCAAA